MEMQSLNLTIPRGKILFAKFLTGTQTPGPLREFGNCPEFTMTRESETLQHYSSQQGLRTLDEEVVIEATLNGNVVTDDIKAENVAYWFMGEVDTVTSAADTDVTETFADVKAGDIFQLGRTSANPSGQRLVENVVVTDGEDVSPVTFVVNTDYVLDADLGIISIPAGSTAIGGNIEVTYDTTVNSRERIAAGDVAVEGEMKFISFNSIGQQADITLPRVKVMPNGDMSMLNDPESTAWQTLALSITAVKKGNLALAYRDGRAVAGT